jgi:hypothetical protein
MYPHWVAFLQLQKKQPSTVTKWYIMVLMFS